MTDRGTRTADESAAHRMYLMYGDDEFAAEAAADVRDALPQGWVLADEPDGASAILAVDAPVDTGVVARAGGELRLIATTEPLAQGLVPDGADVRIVSLPTEREASHRVVS